MEGHVDQCGGLEAIQVAMPSWLMSIMISVVPWHMQIIGDPSRGSSSQTRITSAAAVLASTSCGTTALLTFAAHLYRLRDMDMSKCATSAQKSCSRLLTYLCIAVNLEVDLELMLSPQRHGMIKRISTMNSSCFTLS
jgi:hypothetical protein